MPSSSSSSSDAQVAAAAAAAASVAVAAVKVVSTAAAAPTARTASDNATTTTAALDQAAGGDSNVVEEENQLSRDLALFLANPSLRAALADGSLDLASYSERVEYELRQLESGCIEAYRNKSEEIVELRAELTECQSVLAKLHEMLLGFRADLGGLSGEIRQLQEKSRTLDVQLRNRRAAEQGLRLFLEHVVVAPNLANSITTGPITPTFLKAVQELNQIYKDCLDTKPRDWSCNAAPSETAAGREMQRQVTALRGVAAKRVRDYFLRQLQLLRKPGQTNIRMIQVHGLLRYAALQDFLQDACPMVATEILNVYVESMSKTLLSLFRTYQALLLQLDATKYAATRQDVLAIDDAMLRDTLTTRAKKRVDVFCLGRRAVDCLSGFDNGDDNNGEGTGGGSPDRDNNDEAAAASAQPIIMAHVALSENIRYPYERLFRSLVGHLVDAVTNEHVFCRQFFKRDCFQPLFHNTLGLLLEQLENYLFGCYDALCLLLMIKVTHSYRRLARNRKIHSLDAFFDQVTKLLWPRLKSVMEGHLRSLKQATAARLGDIDLHTHYVTRRFAEFCCSILLILHSKQQQPLSHGGGKPPSGSGTTPGSPRNKRRSLRTLSDAKDTATSDMNSSSGGGMSLSPHTSKRTIGRGSGHHPHPHHHNELEKQHKSAGDKLLEDLSEMIDEYINLLQRLSEELDTQKKRIVFQINNLDHVVCIFQERRVVGKEFNRFVEMLMQQRDLFVEEELVATGFSKMIAFVQQTEQHLSALAASSSKGTAGNDVNPQVVESLVLDFASNWKSNIDQINRNVLSYFSNFRNGMEILKQVLTQLLLYYTRFHDIIRKVWRNKPPAFCKDLVPTNLILTEIKKYALAI